MQRSSSRLHFITDMSPAGWIANRAIEFDYTVSLLLPGAFDCYARIFHPAIADDGHPVRWADVAFWSGKTMYPRAQFKPLSAPQPEVTRADSGEPWSLPPATGSLPQDAFSALCQVLGRHTQAANRCWFCLWDGFADLQPHYYGSRGAILGDRNLRRDLRAAMQGPRVRLPRRAYILLEGPLDAADEIDRFVAHQTPNIFWPNDHAWLVATEIDLDSTYIGGSAEVINDLLRDDRLEAMPVDPNDRIACDSDDQNT